MFACHLERRRCKEGASGSGARGERGDNQAIAPTGGSPRGPIASCLNLGRKCSVRVGVKFELDEQECSGRGFEPLRLGGSLGSGPSRLVSVLPVRRCRWIFLVVQVAGSFRRVSARPE